MRPETAHNVILIIGAGAIGYAGWSGNACTLPATTFFPALWSLARTRLAALLVSAAYFLAASRGLPQAVVTFYQSDLWPGLILWLIASSGFVAIHAALWSSRDGHTKWMHYLVLMVVLALPPFGIVGWAHPITAAGILFPGWGWLGLFIMATALIVMATRHRCVAVVLVVGLWLCCAVSWTAPRVATAWQPIQFDLGARLGRDSSLHGQRDLAERVLRQRDGHASILLLPESAFGFWTPAVAHAWQRRLAGSGLTLVGGAAVVDTVGYDNALVLISEERSEIIYRQRMPVPGAMWQPWLSMLGKTGGARAHVFENPVANVSAVRIAPLICYEQLIVWPVLQSMLYQPDVVVAVGNGWWANGTSIVAIQQASTTAWARLFNIPLIMSFNL